MPSRSDLHGPSRQTYQGTQRRPGSSRRWAEAVIVLTLAIAFIVIHVAIPGAVPSGTDPGGWLSMAKERFGIEVLAAPEATYLPGFPLLLGSLLAVADAILAITIAGVFTKVALVLAIYLVVRPVGLGYAAGAAVIVGMSGAHGEMYAWGGFPQQLGTALGIFAVCYLVRYLESQKRSHLALSALAVAATLFTHNLVGGLLVGALVMSAIHWLYLTQANRRRWITGLRDAAILAIPAGLFVATYLAMGQREGRQPSLNPGALTWAESVQHMINEALIPWLVVAFIGLAVSVSRKWSGPHAATVSVGGSWVVVSLMFFFIIGEVRALLLTQMGIVLMAIPGYAELLRAARSRNDYARDSLVVLGIVLTFAVVTSGYTDYDMATDWYRVVDHKEIATLDHLAAASLPDDLAVSSAGHHENQIGWWVQGYAELPTYPGGNINFLASPQERTQGTLANHVFEDPVDSERVADLLDQIGARFVIVDRRGPHAVWLDSEFARSLKVFDDSSDLVVLELPTDKAIVHSQPNSNP